eukprot:gene30857-38674_t
METEDGSAGGLREYATFLEQHIVAVSTYIQFQTQALNGAWTERMDNWIIGKLRMKALQVTNFSASTIGTLVTDIHRVKKRWGGTGIARFNRARESTAVAAAVGLLEQGERLECVVERFNLEHYAKTYGRTPESPHFKDEHGKGLEYRPGKGIQRHEFWAKAMRVATKVGLTLDFDGNSFTRYGTRVKLKRKKAGKRLAVDYEDKCWDNLKQNAAQGAYFRAIPTSARESLRLFPRFDLPDKLVVFALVARCDNLPVNVVLVRKQMRFSEACECAGCDGSRETITHVLSGCGARSGMYTVRHNAVADAFVGAIEASLRADGWEVARECFPDPVWSATGPEINGTQTHRKPDIVLYHVGLRIVLVIEVKCPSELCVGGMQKVLTDAAPRNGGGNLRDDDEALIQGQAYFRSARRARRNGWQAWARALVVGALGAVDESEVRELVKPLKLEKAQIKKAVAAVQVEESNARVQQLNQNGVGDEWKALFWSDRKKALKQLREKEDPCPITNAILCHFYGVEYDNKYRTDRSQMSVDDEEKEILPPFPEEAFEELLQARMREKKAKAETPFTPEQKAKYLVEKLIKKSDVRPADVINRRFTRRELIKVIKRMLKDKAPGLDGVPYELLK